MILGISGKARSGKDTTAAMIADMYPNTKRIGFADSLKASACALLDISLETLEELKTSNYSLMVAARLPLLSEKADDEISNIDLTFREFLQLYGTEAHREVFGTNFWIDAAEKKIEYGKLNIFTDVRFPNEIEAVRKWGGGLIKVKRAELETVDGHASEQDLPDHLFDWIIENDGSMYELRDRVEILIEEIRYMDAELTGGLR